MSDPGASDPGASDVEASDVEASGTRALRIPRRRFGLSVGE